MLSGLTFLCMCGLGLCPFSGLYYDLLLRSRKGLRLKAIYICIYIYVYIYMYIYIYIYRITGCGLYYDLLLRSRKGLRLKAHHQKSITFHKRNGHF